MVTTNKKTLTHKFTTADVKTVDDAEGIVEAYVNTMGVVDHDGEVIDFAAFDNSIKKWCPIVTGKLMC